MSGRHATPEEPDSAYPRLYPEQQGETSGSVAGTPEDTYFDIELFAPPVAGAPAPAQTVAATPRPAAAFTPPQPITAVGVSYARAGRTILDGVDVSVRPGESVAVVGPSGSGKTSLLALLAGLERPDAGTVHRDPRDRIGLILQSYGLVGVLTGAENVEAPLQAGVAGRLTRAEIRSRSAAALDAVGLTPVADHLIEELSGGQQQRVAVARALATDPAIVLADELTAELDHDWKETVVRLVTDVAVRGGAVALATHDLELAGRCDRIVRIADGRVADGRVADGRVADGRVVGDVPAGTGQRPGGSRPDGR